jgi:predicted anti-sigma-YlaC factor YlaD
MQKHPTAIELELARTGEAEEAVAAHIEACADCRAELDRAAALAAELDRPLEPLTIQAEREQAVIDLARRRAAEIGRQQRRRARRPLRVLAWAVPLAAAAAVALVFLVPGLRQAETPVASEFVAPAGPDDVNQDGRVDILDAFALARAIEADAAAGDNADVERVAMTAVAIAPTGGGR